ncbi:MAG: AMIN domain-containing protein [Deltaproteobacteria bacterium]|nr:AMIN domain-containing protein [Deltaproteobacteria bacterium]
MGNAIGKKWMMLLLIAGITFIIISVSIAAEWGKVMYPHAKTNIRAKRSFNARIKGQLEAGQAVKVDFLKDSWYAVFKVMEERRSESKALGYVHVSRLYRDAPEVSEITSDKKKRSENIPLKADQAELPPIDVKNIRYFLEKEGKESIFIEFNRFYTPAMSTIQGKAPRIVLDITNVSSFKKEWAVISVGGKLIRRIRGSINLQTNVARIVLDMEPSKDYSVNPVFYEKENTYSLEISEENIKQNP